MSIFRSRSEIATSPSRTSYSITTSATRSTTTTCKNFIVVNRLLRRLFSWRENNFRNTFKREMSCFTLRIYSKRKVAITKHWYYSKCLRLSSTILSIAFCMLAFCWDMTSRCFLSKANISLSMSRICLRTSLRSQLLTFVNSSLKNL
jgi:hypothetical protein